MDDDQHMTDADAEGSRVERFRALPPRIRPDEMVELAETRPARGRPVSALTDDEQVVRYAG
ncbi:hypothetical protein [Actinoplanes awajinensis]|uniref:Uncharacterized protein n=1 Tax=Actinoplanes awajinensis subsp. mycoplanecinus TaxID=135947 RepID=A0A101JNH2_9ACTN|nr:hypothetical protein [Actinoplanes awajinensis]KUL30019.1 hypothetical protein ADL15_25970 [Actinoplanes awajinensis subsp. mycoplanecinus]